MFDMNQIGKKIVELRKSKNMTQVELADKLCVSFQAVSNWERGNSMPDISKLPELAQIFNCSIDELICEKSTLIEAVVSGKMDEYIENEEISKKEFENVVPILKPTQTKEIIEKVSTAKNGNIAIFLPFMAEDDVKEFAEKDMERGKSIAAYLPFMKEKDVRVFAEKDMERGESIAAYLPFMDEDDVRVFAEKDMERGKSIAAYLPFMKEKDVKELAVRMYTKQQGDEDN